MIRKISPDRLRKDGCRSSSKTPKTPAFRDQCFAGSRSIHNRSPVRTLYNTDLTGQSPAVFLDNHHSILPPDEQTVIRGIGHDECLNSSYRACLSPAQSGGFAEADQSPALFIPEIEPHRFQTAPKRQRAIELELRCFLQATLQIVVGNAGPEMMNVMEADIPRKPLQQFRQFVK